MSIPPDQMLFGLLACQQGHLTFEDLISSAQAWAESGSNDFREMLREQFQIDDQASEAIRAQCESSQPPDTKGLEEDLETLAGHSQIVHGDLAGDPEATTDHRSGDSTLGGATGGDLGRSTSDGRFRVLGPLDGGKGGMGIIHIAEDSELGRQVALKQIRSERADEEFDRRKFQLEAEVTGNLEHPGIVPVYGLGADHSGRPFYAMRLVSGEDFGSEIERFHKRRETEQVGCDSVEFRSLIDRLIGVAQAVDYAHSRGVLHRDLKPGNVMVGRFGETLVIDWGLARLPKDEGAGRPDGAQVVEDPLEVRSAEQKSRTMFGAALGTLGFAAPEQMSGDLEAVDVRSDVYSLGAILFQILTGTTTVPVSGRSREEVVGDVAAGRVTSPDTLVKGLPKPLVAICMKTLQKQPADRYRTVREFVDELERWKADQPVLARRENLIERLGRLARKHRAATVSAALALTAITVVSVLALIEVNRQRGLANSAAFSEKQQRFAAERAQQVAVEAADAERAAKQVATELADRKQRVVDAFVAAFQIPNVTDFATTQELNSGDMTAVQVLEQALDNLDSNESLQDDEKSKATLLFAIGSSLRSVGKLDRAQQALERSLKLHQRQFGENHVETAPVQMELAHVMSRLGQGESALALVQAVADHWEETKGPNDPTTLMAKGYLADVLRESGESGLAIGIYEDLIPRMGDVLGEEAPDTLVVEAGLALCYLLVGRHEEAIGIMERVLPLHEKVFGPRHPKTVLAMMDLANSYSLSSRVRESLPVFQQAAETMEARLGEQHPSTILARASVANGFFFLGNYNEALPLLEAANEDLRAVFGERHPQVLTLMNNLAMTYQGLGRYQEAFGLFEENMALRKAALGEEHIDTIGSMITFSLGYQQVGQFQKALDLLEQAEKLLRAHHGDTHLYLIQALALQGGNQRSLGNLPKAIEMLEETVELSSEVLGEEDPTTFACMESLATTLRIAGRLQEGKVIISKLRDRRSALMGADDYGTLMATLELSAIEFLLNETEESLEHSEEVLAGYQSRGEIESPVAIKARVIAGSAQHRLQNYSAAADQFQQSLEASARLFGAEGETTLSAQVGLGFALCGLERDSEALDIFQQVADTQGPMASNSIVAQALDGWQNLLMKAGRYSEAKPIIERWVAHPVVESQQDPNMRINARLALCWVLVELDETEAAVDAIKGLPAEIGTNNLALAKCRSLLGWLEWSVKESEDAEENLKESVEFLLAHEGEFESFRRWQLISALKRLIAFYDANEREADAGRWQPELEGLLK